MKYRINITKTIFICTLTALCLLQGCKFRIDEYTVCVNDALNTSSKISVTGGKNAKKTAEECAEIIYRYDELFSATNPSSEIYKLNSSNENTAVSQETFEIISFSENFYQDTDGSFDITVGALSEVWNNSILTSTLPSAEKIAEVRTLTDYSSLILNSDNYTVQKSAEGQKINLGAVAKGYIADIISKRLKNAEIHGAVVDLGGNVYVCGQKVNGGQWKVGVQDPSSPSGLIGHLTLADKFIITSGDYQRYTEIDGKRYHHIIDAKTGYPAENSIRSVTIVSDNGLLGDALSTACFLEGLDRGIELVNKYGVSGIFVTDDNNVYYSSSLSDIFSGRNENYSYIEF